MRIAVFFFLLLPLSARAADPAWEALLHFSGSSSSVKAGSPFFLAPNGFRDPDAELEATKRYFAEKPAEASCRYPARAIYLDAVREGEDKELQRQRPETVELCTRWKKWREAISAKGAELVFAAAFLASPSSMYGHTLLKFVRSGRTEGEDLLDYTLNYGAKTGSSTGAAYVWKGLTGGFDGNYATAPFYLKVKEYNFVENRDFWIYPLLLSERELRLLVAHAWELRDVDFPYFFLRRNCAFYLLEILQVLRPGSKLTSHFPLWTVPVDTIRVLSQGGWLGAPRYRPSRYRRLKELRARLAAGEEAIVESLLEPGASPFGREFEAPTERRALLLDTAYELWRYRHEGLAPANDPAELSLLRTRAALGEPPAAFDFSAERPPELGHPSARLGLGAGLSRRHTFTELHYRGTLHDLLADPHGYESFSELSMGDLRLRLEQGTFFLERFDVLRLRSVAPTEAWFPRAAWHFRAGAARAKGLIPCEAWRCLSGGLEGGYGLGLRAFGPLTLFATLDLKVEAGAPFDGRGWRLGAGPGGGLFLELTRGTRLLLEGEWRWSAAGSRLHERNARGGLGQQLGRLWDLRLVGEVQGGYREAALQAFHYF